MEYLVSYADTDAGGVLHHARYLELAESSRHWWLKNRALSFSELNEKYRFVMTVYNLSAKYQKPVFLEDNIIVHTELSRLDRTGLDWVTKIVLNGNVACQMTVQMVCVDSETKKIIPVPNDLIEELTADIAQTKYRGLMRVNN